jgi:hypothetical protein
MKENLSRLPSSHNSILSEETIAAVIEKYLSLHGPCTEQCLVAVVKAATNAATSLVCFQMTMRGDLVPDLKASDVCFRNASRRSSPMEACGDIMRRMIKEAGL